MKIAITGSSGLIGSALRLRHEEEGHTVLGVSRSEGKSDDSVRWDPGQGEIERSKLEGVEAVVHLAGENIASGRWTEEQRRKIRDSRVVGTRFLSQVLTELEAPPKVFVSASAIGYYGSRGDEILDEDSDAGEGFLSEVAKEWEEAALTASQSGIRTVLPRIGVVLSTQGGALQKMLTPFKFGLGGRIGSGRQYFSWIGIHDLVEGIRCCLLEEGLKGPVNLVAPNPVTNREFTKTLGKVLKRPTPFPVPSFVLQIVLGKMAAEALVLSSTRVVPKRLEESGFRFSTPNLEEALHRVLGERI